MDKRQRLNNFKLEEFEMSKAAKSVFVFGIYLIILGLSLLFFHNKVLELFGLPKTTEPWIYVVSILVLVLSYYCIQSARQEITAFFHLTVHGRILFLLLIICFVLAGILPLILILFGLIDFIGAIWTFTALKN